MKEYVKDYNELCIKIGAVKAPAHYQTSISYWLGCVTIDITAKISNDHIIIWHTTREIDLNERVSSDNVKFRQRFWNKSFWRGKEYDEDEINRALRLWEKWLINKYARPLVATEGSYEE